MSTSNHAGEFVRKLTAPLEKKLLKLFEDKQSWLYRWFEASDEQKPLLAIRGNYANIYVKGCAFKIVTGEAKLVFNANYLSQCDCEQLREELEFYLDSKGKNYSIPSDVMNEFSLRTKIVKAALNYINPNMPGGKKSEEKERPRVTDALVKYDFSLDCEIAFPAKMVACVTKNRELSIKKPDALLLKKTGGECILRFFEAKDGDNPNEWDGRADNPAILGQVSLYDRLISEYKDRIVEQYKYVIRFYGKLGAGNHPRFRAYKEFNDNPQLLDRLELDPHHDVVLLGSGRGLTGYEESVQRLRDKLNVIPDREHVHISLNAADWVK